MNFESKKVFFCLGSMGRGGAERVVANLANYFIKRNDVSIIVTKHSGFGYELNKKINYITLDKADEGKKNILYRTTIRTRRLRKILKNESPDIVISFLPEPSYRLMMAKSFLRTRTIISVRNDPNVEYSNLLKKLLVRLLYTRADGFVFQTPDARKWFSRRIQKKSVVIPNPVDEKFLCIPYSGRREKTVVNVGRLVEQKNQRLLIDAFYEFHKMRKDYCLKIYGDGPLKNDLQKRIQGLGLTKSVKLMGEVSDIKKEIYKASMFVLTSDYEGMPNALMEAMALGVPCISTDCPIGGPKSLIDNNKDGILVNIRNIGQLIDAMLKISQNSAFSNNIALSANKKIIEGYDSRHVTNMWAKYISAVLGGEK